MALQGCCQVFVTGVLLLVLIGPFAIVEAALCFIMGLIFGLFYLLTSCLWMSQAKQVRAKGCWLLREALLYAAAGISFAILPLTLVTLRGISRANKNFKFATIPTFVGFVDVNRFLAFKYLSCAPLTGASSFEEPPRDSFPLWACCKSVSAAEPTSVQMKPSEAKNEP